MAPYDVICVGNKRARIIFLPVKTYVCKHYFLNSHRLIFMRIRLTMKYNNNWIKSTEMLWDHNTYNMYLINIWILFQHGAHIKEKFDIKSTCSTTPSRYFQISSKFAQLNFHFWMLLILLRKILVNILPKLNQSIKNESFFVYYEHE